MVISLAQVVAAMAAGAIVPFTALMTIDLRRIRRRRVEGPAEPALQEPDRIVDDDALDRQVEAVAQLAAAHFDLADLAARDDRNERLADSAAEARPKGHLTLIPTARVPRYLNGSHGEKKRSSSLEACPQLWAGQRVRAPRQQPPSLTRE